MQHEREFDARIQEASDELKRRREAAALPNNLGNYRPRSERPRRSPTPRGPIHSQILSIISATAIQSAMRDLGLALGKIRIHEIEGG
jgi:hypothetical protein